MIVLTQAQANQVRGETTDGNALEPVMLADGVSYVLPEEVLTDPAHAANRVLLQALATREIAANEWVQS